MRFAPDSMTVEFTGIRMNCKERYVNGEKQDFPYKPFDRPFLQSEYGTGIYRVAHGEQTAVCDFNI